MSQLLLGVGSVLPSVGGAAPPFSPLDVAGLQLWLAADVGVYQDAARTTPAVADGAPVGGVADQSGLGHHVSQATSSKRATLKLGIVNSKSVLRFDGVDDGLVGVTGVVSAMPYTLIVVYQSTDTDGIVAGYGDATGNILDDGLYKDGTNTLAQLVQNGSGNALYQSVAASGAGFHVAALRCTGTDSSFSGETSVDGVSLAGPTTGSGARGTTTTYRFQAGQNAANGFSPCAMDLAEVLVYDSALSNANLTALTTYLGAKYGVF